MGALNKTTGEMKTCAIVLLLAVAAFAEFHPEDASFGMEFRSGEAEPTVDFIQDKIPETLLTAVETLRRTAPKRVAHHIKAISTHAQLLQTGEGKETAYKHTFAASNAAIKAALQSLAKELAAGHSHDKAALNTSKASGGSVVRKADAKGLSTARALRHKVCPSQRAEEAALIKKNAADAKLTAHESVRVCGALSTTWDDMNIQKSDMKYGTALHNAWSAARKTWSTYKAQKDAAIRAHNAAKAFNVNTRKQTFIATLVITCYVDNMTNNASAKAC